MIDILNRTFILDDNKFAVLGDLHLSSTTPKSRIDDYATTVFTKLDKVREILKERDIHNLILLGDIFTSASYNSEFEYKVISEFLRFKQSKINVFSIVGNHDVKWDRQDTLPTCSLGVLFITGVIKPFRRLQFKGCNVYGCHFPDNLEKPYAERNGLNICMAHKFYDNGFDDDCLKPENLIYDYDMYFLGHDHSPYKEVKLGDTTIYRPGSFTRGTAHGYNIERNIYMYIYEDGNVELEDVPCEPAEKVYSCFVTDSVELGEDYQSQLSELVNSLYGNKETNSIYTVLETIQMNDAVKSRVQMYLNKFGIYKGDS